VRNTITLANASNKNQRRAFQSKYPEGWSRNPAAITQLEAIKANIADPLLEARSAYCTELSRLSFTDVVGELQAMPTLVVELKVWDALERDSIERRAA
jgi:hypothetical protein